MTGQVHRGALGADIASTHVPAPYAGLPDRLRLASGLDVAALAGELARLERACWTAHFVTEHYVGDWSVLPLRAPCGVEHPILRIAPHHGQGEWQDTEHLPSSSPFREALSLLPAPCDAVRLMRLGPGGRIAVHRDDDLAPEYGAVRLHVPIRTNRHVAFRLNGTLVPMAPGELWFLRLSDPHSVVNDGTVDRVHLVIDCRMTDALAALFARAS